MRAILLYQSATKKMVDIEVPVDDDGKALWAPYYEEPEWREDPNARKYYMRGDPWLFPGSDAMKKELEHSIHHRTFRLLYVRKDGVALYRED